MKMTIVISLAFFVIISTTTYGQNKDFLVLHSERCLGDNLQDSSKIIGVEYIFPERIHETFLDTTNGFLTVQLRGLRKEKWLSNKGNILQYDLNNKTLLWSKKIAYQASSLQQFSNTMILTSGVKSNCLDIRTGCKIWDLNSNISFVDPDSNIGIGYSCVRSDEYLDELDGIDLSNGKVIWKKELSREYGWNDIFYTNDSTVVLVAAGLHAINIQSGTSWHYNAITGKKDYTETAVANAVGVAAGLLTGTYSISSGHNLVRDVVSNALVDSSYIYFGSKEQIVKIDKETGNVIWKHPIPKDLASKSTIVTNDSIVFMVNLGYAYMGYRKLSFGKPFIAAFDKQTGVQKYINLITDSKEQIQGLKIKNKEVYLVLNGRIEKYSIETGYKIAEKEFSNEYYGDVEHFIGNHVFVTNNKDELISLPKSDTTKLFVYTNSDMTLCVDQDLNVIDTIGYKALGFYYQGISDYKLIAKGTESFLINAEEKCIAKLKASSNAFLIGKTLYDRRGNSFISIDLKGIIEDEEIE